MGSCGTCSDEGSYISPALDEERSHSIHSLAELHGSANGKLTRTREPVPLPAKYSSCCSIEAKVHMLAQPQAKNGGAVFTVCQILMVQHTRSHGNLLPCGDVSNTALVSKLFKQSMRRQMRLLLECCTLGAQRTRHLFLTSSISKFLLFTLNGRLASVTEGPQLLSLFLFVLVLVLVLDQMLQQNLQI